MNDRDPFDPIDRMLDDTFRTRPAPPLARPSLTDVHHRARRRQQRRTAGMVGALAVVGMGGAVALATRDDARTQLTPAADDLGTATTIGCPSVATTTFPPTTAFNTVPPFDRDLHHRVVRVRPLQPVGWRVPLHRSARPRRCRTRHLRPVRVRARRRCGSRPHHGVSGADEHRRGHHTCGRRPAARHHDHGHRVEVSVLSTVEPTALDTTTTSLG